jgi:hypothetical protein
LYLNIALYLPKYTPSWTKVRNSRLEVDDTEENDKIDDSLAKVTVTFMDIRMFR